MYLHIGKNCVIKNKCVIGIFSIANIKDTDEYKKLKENMKENINDVSNGQNKTFILTKEDNIIKGYISNIGIDTIKKRKIQK